jgi:hypothetical protein
MPAARAGVAPPTPPTARRLVLPNPRAAAPIAAAARDGAETSEGEARSAPANAAAPGRPAGDLQLMAISQRDGQPIAIIGDRLVHEGDSFDGFKVLRIGESEVELEVRGRRRVLRF